MMLPSLPHRRRPTSDDSSSRRRDLLLAATTSAVGLVFGVAPEPASSATSSFLQNVAYSSSSSGLTYMLDTTYDNNGGRDGSGSDVQQLLVSNNNEQQTDTTTPVRTLSSEYALIKVLPVKNPVFRTLEQNVESLSALRYNDSSGNTIDGGWKKAGQSVDTAISLLVNKRRQLEPVFNPEDNTELAIVKAERGEVLIGELFQDLESLKAAISVKNTTCTFEKQRSALLNLGFLGELLVKEFPYIVPSKGKYSFLPRLMGRARVTFRFYRKGATLGDVTIIADGYTAPITAGNFVDLCIRNFYTGLPIREMTKKVGSYQDPVSLPINVLGSFNEGFYDPITGKLRRIPLEIIRLEGQPKLSYTFSRRFLESTTLEEVVPGGEGTFLSSSAPPIVVTSKPLVTFETPGLVAFNHPSNDPNGGSSEFFALQQPMSSSSSSPADKATVKRNLLDGLYAPFGYIVEGVDIFNSLQADDVIHSTTVDDFGQLNLVKIRSSSFKEVAQGTEEAGK